MAKKPFEKTRITEETFSAELKIVQGNNRATRKAIQGLTIVALAQFEQFGQLAKAKQVYNACKLIGAHAQYLAYLEAHANIKGENVGKVNFKLVKSNKRPATVEPLTDWWYAWEKPEVAEADKPKRDAEKMLETLIKSLTNGIKEHRMKNDVESQALINYLKQYKGFNEQETVAPEQQAQQA